jgi:predicted ATPase
MASHTMSSKSRMRRNCSSCSSFNDHVLYNLAAHVLTRLVVLCNTCTTDAATVVLCMYVLQVTDIADAMVVRQLFERMWAKGLVMVSSST